MSNGRMGPYARAVISNITRFQSIDYEPPLCHLGAFRAAKVADGSLGYQKLENIARRAQAAANL